MEGKCVKNNLRRKMKGKWMTFSLPSFFFPLHSKENINVSNKLAASNHSIKLLSQIYIYIYESCRVMNWPSVRNTASGVGHNTVAAPPHMPWVTSCTRWEGWKELSFGWDGREQWVGG